MCVVVSLIAFFAGCMDGDIGNHSLIDELLLNERPGKLFALLVCEFMGQAQLDFAGKLGVLAALYSFDRVPQLGAVMHPLGCVLWGHHLGVGHAALTAIVVDFSGSLVNQSGC